MRNLENLKIAFNKLLDKEDEILNSLKNKLLKLDKEKVIKELRLDISGWSRKEVRISIVPKSAWSDTINFSVREDKKQEFRTSSGGWNEEENALFEVNTITAILIEFYKNFDFNVFEEHNKLEKEIRKIREEIEIIENADKKAKELENYTEISNKELLKRIKSEEVEVAIDRGGYVLKGTASFQGNRYRIDGSIFPKSYFTDNPVYIKN